jgi:outer membrane protein assembly factor BamB
MTRNHVLLQLAAGSLLILTAGTTAAVLDAQDSLPAGPAKDTFRRICGNCHEPEMVLGNKRTREGWETLVGLMMDLGAQGTDAEMTQIVDYLAANFGVTPAVQQGPVQAPAAAVQSDMGSRPAQATHPGDYLTEGVDNGRTGWLKDERVFNTTNVRTMHLLWKEKIDSTPRQMHNLFAPLTVTGVTTVRGPRELAIFAGISDELYAVDIATGETLWQTKFDSIYPQATQGMGSTLCPGGQTAVPVIATTSTEGKYVLYALSWDGRLHTLDVATGRDVAPPEKFAAPNGKPYALNLFNGVIYASTAQGCGGNTNAFISFDLATKKASIFSPAGGGMWGRRGVAVDPEGRVFMGTGDGPFVPETHTLGTAVVSVKLDENKQLQLVDYFAAPNANFLYRRDLDLNVSPMAFDYRGKKFLVATSKECRLWLLDRDALGGADHRTALDMTPLLCNDAVRYDAHGVWGAMAAWQDAQGRQWVAVPFYGPVSRQFKAPVEHARPTLGGVGAYTVEQTNGKWHLVPQWLSRDMDLAEHVLVANGVLFVYASGEDARQITPDRPFDDTSEIQASGVRRITQSRHAELIALDAATGRELWTSGNTITSWNHYSGLTVANGRAYLATFDGTVYAFGVSR